MLYADHHGNVHEWSKRGVDKFGCLSCVGHMTIKKIHGFCDIIILSSAFSVYSTQTVHIM